MIWVKFGLTTFIPYDSKLVRRSSAMIKSRLGLGACEGASLENPAKRKKRTRTRREVLIMRAPVQWRKRYRLPLLLKCEKKSSSSQH